jgi:hypothetical protein
VSTRREGDGTVRRLPARAAAVLAALVTVGALGTGVRPALADDVEYTGSLGAVTVDESEEIVEQYDSTLGDDGQLPPESYEDGDDDGATPLAKTPTYNYPTADECRNNERAQLGGWTKNRYGRCWVQGIDVRKVQNGIQLGKESARLTLIGKGTRESRTLRIEGYLDQFSGSGVSEVPVALGMQCGLKTSGARCELTPDVPVVRLWGQWKAQRTFTTTLVSKGGSGLDVVAEMGTRLVFDVAGKRVGEAVFGTVRCDSAEYLPPKYGACLFSVAKPRLHYSLSNANHGEVARHIRDAYLNPGSTYPAYSGKRVPGRPAVGPLHRNYRNADWRKTGRTRVQAVCRKQDPLYASKGQQCDEYPFASAREGAGNPATGENFSARPVATKQNQSAGHVLNEFYTENHLLDGDAYYVVVDA